MGSATMGGDRGQQLGDSCVKNRKRAEVRDGGGKSRTREKALRNETEQPWGYGLKERSERGGDLGRGHSFPAPSGMPAGLQSVPCLPTEEQDIWAPRPCRPQSCCLLSQKQAAEANRLP